jgi:hypothetical protein
MNIVGTPYSVAQRSSMNGLQHDERIERRAWQHDRRSVRHSG